MITDRLNRPVKDLRISVMDTCNYRCPYCMPADKFDDSYKFLSPQERLSFDEIEKIVRVFAKLGVNKIRITGGEPLLRKKLPELIARIRQVNGIQDIALTTNGQLLEKQLPDLIQAGLDRVNISIDSLNPELYHQMSGNKGQLEAVLLAIDAANKSSLKSVKLNCVIQKGVNDNEVLPLLEKFKETDIVVRFIEFMDVGNKNDWDPEQVMSFREILKVINEKWPVEALDANYTGEVASRYRYKESNGEIGFITSISQPFCRDCSRARLSADGKLYTCLFATESHDLRYFIRHDENDELQQYIEKIWCNRDDRYSEIRHKSDSDKEKIEMYVIGG